MDTLARLHPHARVVTLREADHSYTIDTTDGPVACPRKTVSKFAEHLFEVFDPDAIVEKNFESWRWNASSAYFGLIQAAPSDAAAKSAIKSSWRAKGEEASRAGTLMHENLEAYANGVDSPDTHEKALFVEWLAAHPEYELLRTEFAVCLLSKAGAPLLAGCIDLVLRCRETDTICLVDYKRVDPTPKRANAPPNLLLPGMAFRNKKAKPPLGDVEDSPYGKYLLQLNLYRYIIERKAYGLRVGRMLLLQMHPELLHAHPCEIPEIDVTPLFAGMDVEE